MHVAVIGGTFDDKGGWPSKIIAQMTAVMSTIGEKEPVSVSCVNGGHFKDLEKILDDLGNADIIMWFASVSNDCPKIRDIKRRYPKAILVTSKRNFRNPGVMKNEYTFHEVIAHALALKSNLLMEVRGIVSKDGYFRYLYGRIIDPLGCVWCVSADFGEVARKLIQRAIVLKGFTREGSIRLGDRKEVPNEGRFFEIIKGHAQTFHDLINPSETTRFLGNASFRCAGGFPSFRDRNDGNVIFVSQRNIDKRYIGRTGFVATELFYDDSRDDRDVLSLGYYGDKKPSVDTPIQLRLYAFYPQVDYMVHSHTYIKGAPFTDTAIPCGAIEEFDSIIALKPEPADYNFCVNLKGHGSLVLAKDLEFLEQVQYIPRTVPEFISY